MEGGRGAAAVFLLALAARVAILFALPGGAAAPLEGDERGYAAAAGSLARGEGYGFTVVPLQGDRRGEERRLGFLREAFLLTVEFPGVPLDVWLETRGAAASGR